MVEDSGRTGALFGIIVGLYLWDKHAVGNRVLVTNSKETTYITEPLRPDGYPDYIAVLNQHFSEGVTPENNSAVLFSQAVGPKSFRMDNEYLEKYYRMLSISPLSEKGGGYFIDSDEHINAWIARQPEQPLPQEHLMGMGMLSEPYAPGRCCESTIVRPMRRGKTCLPATVLPN